MTEKIEHSGLGVSFELDFSDQNLAAMKAAICALSDGQEFDAPRLFWEWCLITARDRGCVSLEDEEIETMKPAVLQWLTARIMDRAIAAFDLKFYNRQTVAFEKAKKGLSADDPNVYDYFRSIILAALNSGCIDIDKKAIQDLHPAIVRWLVLEITDAYQEATTIPPE